MLSFLGTHLSAPAAAQAGSHPYLLHANPPSLPPPPGSALSQAGATAWVVARAIFRTMSPSRSRLSSPRSFRSCRPPHGVDIRSQLTDTQPPFIHGNAFSLFKIMFPYSCNVSAHHETGAMLTTGSQL